MAIIPDEIYFAMEPNARFDPTDGASRDAAITAESAERKCEPNDNAPSTVNYYNPNYMIRDSAEIASCLQARAILNNITPKEYRMYYIPGGLCVCDPRGNFAVSFDEAITAWHQRWNYERLTRDKFRPTPVDVEPLEPKPTETDAGDVELLEPARAAAPAPNEKDREAQEPVKLVVVHKSARELLKKFNSQAPSPARTSSVSRSKSKQYDPFLSRKYDPVDPYEAEDEFRNFLLSHVEPDDPYMPLISDGKTHRFAVAKGSGNKDGEYYLHVDGTPNGGVRDWRNSNGNSSCVWIKWRWDHRAHDSRYTLCSKSEMDIERAALKKQRDAQRAEAEQAREQAHDEAAKEALSYFQNLGDAPTDHGYLRLKQIPFVRGMAIKQSTNTLRVPLFNETGELRTYQTIFFDPKTKKFSKRYQKDGDRSCTFCVITQQWLGPLPDAAKFVGLCEGIATGLSAYEAVKGDGAIMVCCMDCHSIRDVAPVVRRKYPNAEIFIFADDDHNGDTNPGISNAEAAARAIALPLSHVILPLFKSNDDLGTDFNDFACKYGIESMIAMVRGQIERASERGTRELSFTEKFVR